MIQREIGDVMTFRDGEEPEPIRVEVVASAYHNAEPGDKLLKITNCEHSDCDHGNPVISLDTMRDIMAWAMMSSVR